MKISLFLNLLLGAIVGGQNPHAVPSYYPLKEASPIPTNLHSAEMEKQVISNRRNCRIGAYVIDEDPQGLNVRNAPNSSSRVIRKLPTVNTAVFVNITASQGQWLEIIEATDDREDTLLFQGKGWVFSSLLGTSTRGYETRSVSVYASNSNREC